MKKFALVPMILILLGICNASAQTPEELQGVWKMTYKKWELSDTVVERSEYEFNSYKIFFEDHFSLTGLDEENEFYGHFGNYTFDGEIYTEEITFSSYEFMIGRTVEFDSKLKGDTWTIKGDIGTEGMKFELVEIWERVD
jgi:hypothetical protein